jgi:hypothetical protein
MPVKVKGGAGVRGGGEEGGEVEVEEGGGGRRGGGGGGGKVEVVGERSERLFARASILARAPPPPKCNLSMAVHSEWHSHSTHEIARPPAVISFESESHGGGGAAAAAGAGAGAGAGERREREGGSSVIRSSEDPLHLQRDLLHMCQKRPTHVSKETYTCLEDPLHLQRRSSSEERLQVLWPSEVRECE